MIRAYVFSELEVVTPARQGSGRASLATDLPVQRDSRGIPFVSGNAMAAAIAAHAGAEKYLRRKDGNEFNPSKIIVEDAFPLPAQANALRGKLVEIRPSVAIERSSVTAKEGAHFTYEVLPVGTVFLFACRCDADNDSEADSMIAAVKAFLSAGGRIGGKINAGYGRWNALGYTSRTFDLSKKEDLLDWLIHGHGFEWLGSESLPMQLNLQWKTDLHNAANDSDTDWTTFEVYVAIEGGLHLCAGSSGLPSADEPDQRQARRVRLDRVGKMQYEFVDFGTAIRGRLRSAMEMLVRTHLKRLGGNPDWVPCDPSSQTRIDELTAFLGFASRSNKGPAQAKAQWRVEEAAWTGANASGKEDHIRLDHITQHTMNGALFDFAPLRGGECTFKVYVKSDAPWKTQLMSHALTLLSLDIIPFGGKGARGYLGARVSYKPKISLLGKINTWIAENQTEKVV